MAEFNFELNSALGGFRTAARYDTDAEKWLTDSAMWVKNTVGIYVPVSDTDPIPSKSIGVVTVAIDIGTATGGSKTTIVDTTQNFEANMLAGDIVRVNVGGIDYYRTVASNTADTITISTLPGAPASAILGNPGVEEVTVTCVTDGIGGNEYTAEIIEAPGTDDNLSASLTGLVLTVYLGKTGGVLDNAKNTATAVAEAIDQIPEFIATMTGSGGVMPVTVESVEFTGGVAVVTVTAGSKYEIKWNTVHG